MTISSVDNASSVNSVHNVHNAAAACPGITYKFWTMGAMGDHLKKEKKRETPMCVRRRHVSTRNVATVCNICLGH